MSTAYRTSLLTAARDYAARGLAPIATRARSAGAAPKMPCGAGWQRIAPGDTAAAEFEKRLPAGGPAGLGLVCGEASGLFVLDVDVKDGGVKRWNELTAEHGAPETPTVETPTGGLHVYFAYGPEVADLSSTTKVGGVGLDIRSNRTQVVAPPTVVGDKAYRWRGDSIATTAPAPPPAWLVSELRGGVAPAAPAPTPPPAAPAPAAPAPPLPPADSGDVYGSAVMFFGKRCTLTLDTLRTCLALVPCPDKFEHWGYLLRCVKTLTRGIDDVSAAHVRDCFDEWSQRGDGYDALGNLENWNAAPCESTQKYCWESLAKAAYHAARRVNDDYVGTMTEPGETRTLKDLVRMWSTRGGSRPEVFEYEGSEYERAVIDCVVVVSGGDERFVFKNRAATGEIEYNECSALRGLSSYSLKLLAPDENGKPRRPLTLSAAIRQTLSRGHLARSGLTYLPYAPGTSPPETSYLNMFLGFATQRLPEGENPDEGLLAPLLRHLSEVWCAGDDVIYREVIRWLAFLFQHPAKLPLVGLVLISKQGAGKGIITNLLGQMLGDRLYTTEAGAEVIVGRFNSRARGRRLINLNEVCATNWRNDNNRLKALMTDPVVTIERKGKDPFAYPNYSAFIFCSNDTTPVLIESDDRRFNVLNLADFHLPANEHPEYWDPLLEALNDERMPSHFLEYLMRQPLETDRGTPWHPKGMTRTSVTGDMMRESVDPAVRFAINYLEEHYLPEGWVGKNTFRQAYLKFCDSEGERALSQVWLGRKLKQIGLEPARINVGGDRRNVIRAIRGPVERSVRKMMRNPHWEMALDPDAELKK